MNNITSLLKFILKWSLKYMLLLGGIILAVFILLIFADGKSRLNSTSKTDSIQEHNRVGYLVPPEADRIISLVGIERSVFVDEVEIRYQDVTQCRSKTVLGCYSSGLVIIKKNSINNPVVLSHEYMHFVWHKRLDKSSQERISTLVNEYLNANEKTLSQRLVPYGAISPEERTDEIQAILCTEIPDKRLPKEFLDYCVEYLPNRNTLLNTAP